MVALVDKDLKKLISENILISNSHCDLMEYVQPASIDIPIGNVAYLVKQKFLPFSQKVNDIVEKLSIEQLDLSKGAILFKGQTYLIPVMDIHLPSDLSIHVSPKSSIGRIDLMVRTIFDNTGLYDTVSSNSMGTLWLEISPQSFNVKIQEGQCLNQMMVFKGKDAENLFTEDLVFDTYNNPLPIKEFDLNTLILSLQVSPNSLFGYEAISTNEVIDLSQIGTLNWRKFFREILIGDKGKFTLEKDRFYILATKENIRVPSHLSAEMLPFSHLIGELRAHYAGFFDPGFGSDFGAIGVLEVRPHETLTVYDGQPICLMKFFKNSSIPEKIYGEVGNNYQGQRGPKLAKYFNVD
jgi:dCTP deaminase